MARSSALASRKAHRCFLISCLALLALFSMAMPPRTAEAQSEFRTQDRFVEETVLANLPISTTVAFAPDGRIYIALKEGIVRVAQDGVLLPTPFINISAETNKNTDRGLLGLALDPQFPTRPYIYMLYVYDPPDRTPDAADPRLVRLIRVQADASKGYNVALPNSTEIILGKNSTSDHIAEPINVKSKDYSNDNPEPASCMIGNNINGTPIEDCLPVDGRSHSAGTLIFADDGSLYVSVGDGSSYDGTNRPALRTQNIDSLAGKVLRINPDTGKGMSGNPFFEAANPGSNRSRVWAYGLRNPFRVTLNPSSGQVYLGDVGSSGWEEVNSGKGVNFGWPCYEGGVSPNAGTTEGGDTISIQNGSYANYSRTKDVCRALYAQGEGAVQSPLFSYAHQYIDGNDQGGSVSGVAFYSGLNYPERYRGALFIGDYALRTLRYLTFDNLGKASVHDFAYETTSGLGIVQLLSGPDKNIYALYLNLTTRSSELRRFLFIDESNTPPQVRLLATPTAGSVPLSVSFVSDGTFDPDGQQLTYSWDFGDGSPVSTLPNPVHVYQKVGTFTATLTVTEASAPFAASTGTATIRTGVSPPQAFIDSPAADATYRIGDTINFSGHATFTQFEDAPTVQLSWSIIQHHNDHTHLEQEVDGTGGSFVVEEHADNTYYEICLFADAGDDVQDQVCREIHPVHVDYTLASDPVGATITYVDEGLDVLAPYVVRPIVNSSQTIVAAPVYADRSFTGWSDGVLTAERTFITGETPQTFTANYKNLDPHAAFTATPTTGLTPLTVAFDGSASSDPEGTLLSFAWDFGDGSSATGNKPEHTFTASGTFTVLLTVTDKLGATASAEGQITVVAPTPTPTSTFTPSPTPTHTPIFTSTATPTFTATVLPTSTNTPLPPATSTPSPVETSTATPTAAAAVITPEPIPTSDVGPEVIPATPTPVMVPIVTFRPPLKLKTSTSKSCGTLKAPCLLPRNRAADALSKLGKARIDSVGGLDLIIEGRNKRGRFTQVASLPAVRKGEQTYISARLPLKKLKQNILYRAAYQLRDTIGRTGRKSPLRYFKVTAPRR